MNADLQKILETLVEQNGTVCENTEYGGCQVCGSDSYTSEYKIIHKDDCIVSLAKKLLEEEKRGGGRT
jgi:hypothetical protein